MTFLRSLSQEIETRFSFIRSQHCHVLVRFSTPLIKIVLPLDSEGKRTAVKYSPLTASSFSDKLADEIYVFSKTQRTNVRSEGPCGMLFLQHIASRQI
uniref:Uncharacterized protein n=1 Tax=Physcomitrium patens TaxID=3218 RepID=A0A7I4EQ09_PHYPA